MIVIGKQLDLTGMQFNNWIVLNETKGQIKTLKAWAEITGISKSTLLNRYNDGWSTSDILTTPLKKIKTKKEK